MTKIDSQPQVEFQQAAPEVIVKFLAERDAILKSIKGCYQLSNNSFKLHLGPLSPGCLICGSGHWSCLFINQLCNANCFFCPQKPTGSREGGPSSNNITFDSPKDYVSFLQDHDIKGVSFSGGEPLLVLDRILDYTLAIRDRFGEQTYIWLYTNGKALTDDTLKKLYKVGLDEIRIDLAANNYDFDPIYRARDSLLTVSIEVPAIPEDFEHVTSILYKLEQLGVSYLNLHQLLVTNYNYDQMLARGYSLIVPPKIATPSIIESELTALKIIKFALDNSIKLPINTCTTFYKEEFQHSLTIQGIIACL